MATVAQRVLGERMAPTHSVTLANEACNVANQPLHGMTSSADMANAPPLDDLTRDVVTITVLKIINKPQWGMCGRQILLLQVSCILYHQYYGW